MDIQLNEGYLEVICGSMYAGKTEELLRRIKRIEYAKKSYLLFKPKIDNRYSEDEVVSHNHRRCKSIIISNAKELRDNLPAKLPYCVAIDEVQFFDKDMMVYMYSNNDMMKKKVEELCPYPFDESNL